MPTTRYAPGAKLSDAGFEPEARFSGAALSAAFLYGTTKLGDASFDVRVGEQPVLSGIGIARFMRGMTINMPVDVPAFRRPGYIEPTLLPVTGSMWRYTHTAIERAPQGPVVHFDEDEAKLWLPLGAQAGYWDPETPRPVGAVTAGVTLGATGVSLTGFYQYEWRPTVGAPCGTYFTANDVNTDPSTSHTCNAVEIGQVVGTSLLTEREALAQGRFIRMIDERQARDSGQYGINVWVPLAVAGDAKPQLGLHYLSVHSTAPSLDGIRGAPGQLYDFQPTPVRGRWVYPEDVRTFGISVRTAWPNRPWLAAAELSYTPNAPAQINANDLLFGSVSAGAGPAGARVASVAIGDEVQGYDRVHKTQLVMNGGAFVPPLKGDGVPRWLNWEYGFLFAEIGAQWADLAGASSGLRYGRAFMYGIAPAPGIPSTQTACVLTPGNAGCDNDGYFTRFSWGYRLKALLNIPTGTVEWKPSITWAHDVKGYSIDNQLNEGRRSFEFALRAEWPRFDYGARLPAAGYFTEVKYVGYANRAKFDGLRDRDNVMVTGGITF